MRSVFLSKVYLLITLSLSMKAYAVGGVDLLLEEAQRANAMNQEELQVLLSRLQSECPNECGDAILVVKGAMADRSAEQAALAEGSNTLKVGNRAGVRQGTSHPEDPTATSVVKVDEEVLEVQGSDTAVFTGKDGELPDNVGGSVTATELESRTVKRARPSESQLAERRAEEEAFAPVRSRVEMTAVTLLGGGEAAGGKMLIPLKSMNKLKASLGQFLKGEEEVLTFDLELDAAVLRTQRGLPRGISAKRIPTSTKLTFYSRFKKSWERNSGV